MTTPNDPAARASASSSGSPARLAPVGWPAGLAAATLALGCGIGLWQLARSNRPHELTAAPYVTLLLAASVALAVLALWQLRSVWRCREQRPLSLGHRLLAVLLVPLAVVGTLLLLVAADTAIQVLAG